MMERQTLYRGISCAAWGYFFEYFDFNLNGVSALPAFVGFWLLLKATRLMEEERRDLALLRPLGLILLAWNFLDWLGSFGGDSLKNGSDLLQILNLVVSLANVYFHFQLLTDLAAIAAKYQGEDYAMDVRLLHLRTWQTIFLTVAVLMMYLPLGDWWEGLALCIMVAGMITSLCIMMSLFSLRKLFAGTEFSGD